MLPVLAAEAQPLVEAAAVGGHQVHPLAGGYRGAGQQGLHDPATQAPALVLLGYHHIPQHRPEHPIAGGPADAHQPAPLPGTDHTAAAQQHPHQGPAAAPLSPEAVAIKESPQLVDRQQELQGQAAVAHQLDRSAGAALRASGRCGYGLRGGDLVAGNAGAGHGCAGRPARRPPESSPPDGRNLRAAVVTPPIHARWLACRTSLPGRCVLRQGPGPWAVNHPSRIGRTLAPPCIWAHWRWLCGGRLARFGWLFSPCSSCCWAIPMPAS